jgi:4-alpha-glucanotransferase
MGKTIGSKVIFRINYRTVWGQSVYIIGSGDALGNWDPRKAKKLNPVNEEDWEGEVVVEQDQLDYKYFVGDGQHMVWEFGPNRIIPEVKSGCVYEIKDHWRSNSDHRNNLFRSPFLNAYFHRTASKVGKKKVPDSHVWFRIPAVRIPEGCAVGILGNHRTLGNWNPKKVILLDESEFPVWQTRTAFGSSKDLVEYKYVLVDKKSKNVLGWESGANREIQLSFEEDSKIHIQNDIHFRFPDQLWRGAGVAIPVFSLRSEQSAGIGEFTDLKAFTDWAVQTGLKVIQVLPVNDTTAHYQWTDSYPYASISVQALHPIYLSIQEVGSLKDEKKQKDLDKRAQRLNQLPEVDYEAVLKLKFEFLRLSFKENFESLSKTKAFKVFVENNHEWLKPYAAFCALRDHYQSPDFRQWNSYSSIDSKQLDELLTKGSKWYEHAMLYYYIQFFLDKQLAEATTYARANGVVLKGDIPIGIYRNSVEAWWEPHLFNMDKQAGAPPDDFSITGQNWGFPTYNWEIMEENDFKWWTQRLTKMSEYFDIIRIDHILGFFRIWEIPAYQVDGLLGMFNPALPFQEDEIRHWGINFDFDRFCQPYIRKHMVHEIFQSHAAMVMDKYLEEQAPGVFALKEEVNSQQKIKRLFEEGDESDSSEFSQWLKFNLYRLVAEVLFVTYEPGKYCPRVGLHSTYSYQELSDHDKASLDRMYVHFFYHRHNDFWREKAMRKLPALKQASNMLICGEDLGMVPASVPGVMQDLNILSLAVQRMPNDDRGFWHPSDTPYESVTTTSSHDTSTLREWWQEDPDRSREFYERILGKRLDPPYFMEPWLARDIINQHMFSPSMWAIFPLQDLLAMDAELRREKPEEERINVPANPTHYWRYRMHLTIEQLLEAKVFNESVKNMVDISGRSE